MGMTWRSFENLRRNLGDVGEGVASYIKGRQEDTRREEQAAQMKQFLGSEAGKGIDPGMAQLAFSGHGFNAFPAIAGVQSYRKSIAPRGGTLGSADTGYKGYKEDPFTGDITVGPEILPGKEKTPTGKLFGMNDVSDNDLYIIATTHADPATRSIAENILTRKQADREAAAEAGAGIRENVTKRAEQRAGIAKAAQDYGTQMETAQKAINEAQAQLAALGGKPYAFVNGKKITATELQARINAAKNAWEQARQQLNAIKHKEGTHIEKGTGIAKPITPGMDLSANTNEEGWQKHPAGFDFRMLG